MGEDLLAAAAEQDIWVLMSVVLLVYILKKQEARDAAQEEREHKYQELLTALSEKFSIVSNIQEDVTDIKKQLEKNL